MAVNVASSTVPGGNAPSPWVPNARTFGSLMVHARPTRSWRARPVTSQNRVNRSTLPGSAHPPAAANQRGDVKWWKVTTGSSPRSRLAAHTRR